MVIGGIGIPPRHPIIAARCLGAEVGGAAATTTPANQLKKIKSLSSKSRVKPALIAYVAANDFKRDTKARFA